MKGGKDGGKEGSGYYLNDGEERGGYLEKEIVLVRIKG